MRTLSGSWPIRMLSWCLCVALVLVAVAPEEARAIPSPSVEVGPSPGAERLDDLARIQRVLEQKLVRARLADLGLAEAEVSARLARLDDAELHQLAQRLDEVQAGGQERCENGGCIVFGAFYLAVILVALLVYGVVRLVEWLRSRLTAPSPAGS